MLFFNHDESDNMYEVSLEEMDSSSIESKIYKILLEVLVAYNLLFRKVTPLAYAVEGVTAELCPFKIAIAPSFESFIVEVLVYELRNGEQEQALKICNECNQSLWEGLYFVKGNGVYWSYCLPYYGENLSTQAIRKKVRGLLHSLQGISCGARYWFDRGFGKNDYRINFLREFWYRPKVLENSGAFGS